MTRIRLGVALGLALTVASPALARTFKGVDMPEASTVAGQSLTLIGVGLRKKLVVDVYVAGLYLADPAKDPLSPQPRQLRMVMLRDLDAEHLGKALRDGFEKNSAAALPTLQSRLDKLTGALTALKKGEELVITSTPDRGTVIRGRGKDLLIIEGEDFAVALFKVWLGPKPVDDGLKKSLLGTQDD